MTSFLTDLAKTIVEKLIDGTIAESWYICCFTCIAEEFEQERDILEAERKTVGQRAEEATRKGDDIQENVPVYLEKADKLIQEDTKTKPTCFFGLCPNCVGRYKRGKKLASKMEGIKKLVETLKELPIGLPSRLPDVERYSSQHYISFKSRESKYTELLDALKDNNNYITGLQGMGGTGKTTLAKEVGKQLKQSEQFAQVIVTTVSYTPDIKKIQNDIAGPLGLKLEDYNESDRPGKLWSRLTNGEKNLLILDDVWDPHINFEEIGIPYSDNHKGCRVLVTTRNLWVCNQMGCGRTIQLELLSEEDAWIMFKRHAGLSDISSLLDKGRKIANECKRLPVAIAVIGSSLKGEQRQEEWDVALKSLQKSVSMDGVDDDLVKIYKRLKFSYDYMKDEKAKGLFLLCSVFREDEEIPTEILTRLGIGAGLFGEDCGSYNDARDQVVVAKNKLLYSCLLLEADEGSVKMHDLVREAAQWIANKEIRAINLSNKNQKALVEREKNIKYLLCEGKDMDVFSCKFDGSKLEILIVDIDRDEEGYIEVPNSLFENIVGLRVLLLSINDKHEPPLSLPQSIQSLTNIQSLYFVGVDLGDISILGNLQSLETLDLFKCRIDELPSEIRKLEKLRLLNLRRCTIRRNNPFAVIERCPSLEELYFLASFNGFCREKILPVLRRLRRYHVSKYNYYRGIRNESISKYVDFVGDVNGDEDFSEETLKYLIQTSEVLMLSQIKWGWRNLIPEIVPTNQGMNDLVELRLHCISQLQYLIDTKHNDYQVQNDSSKLVVLKLYQMGSLEELCNGLLSFDFLKSLEKLSIKRCEHLRSLFNCNLNLCNLKRMTLRECPMLISLFQLSTSQSLVRLEELKISDCEQLENIITDKRRVEGSGEEIVDVDNDNKTRGSMFPKLKVLDIWDCPRLEFILVLFSAQDLPILEAIKIESCDGLKYIFGQYQNVELSSLKELQLRRLPNFIDIFPERDHPMSSSMKGSSSRDGSKAQIKLDSIKCNIFSSTHKCCYGHKYIHKSRSTTSTKISLVSEYQPHDSSIASASNSHCLHIWKHVQCLLIQSQIMCNIKEIELSHVSKIKSVFVLSIAPRMLLETLTIRNCDELKHITIDTGDDSGDNNRSDVFPKLKELIVEDCGQLEYIFGHYDHDQNHNEIHLHLPALKCLSLCNLPSLIAMCPKKYRTTFPPLTQLELIGCSQVAIKSIGEFIKELNGYGEYFLALESLQVYDLPEMTYLFVGSKNSFALQNLREIKIVRCVKLEVIFSTSIIRSRCLPRLLELIIEECKELKHIIEDDDVENQRMSNFVSPRTCFPKLETLAVRKCNKLKCVFPVSICKELPELRVLMIREADELEEIFESKGDQKVEIPNLRIVTFVKLPSLCQAQEIQFQAVKNRFVQNCQRLSLTSASTHSCFDEIRFSVRDDELRSYLWSLFEQLRKDSKTQDTSNENPSAETIKDFAAEIEVDAASGHELTSSQINIKQTTEVEHEFVENVPGLEIPSIAISLTKSKCRKETQYQSIQEGSTSEKTVTVGIKRNVEEGTTLADARTITSSTHSESISLSSSPLVTSECKTSSQKVGDGQITTPSFSIATTDSLTTEDVDVGVSQEITESETNNQVSLNDDVVVKVSSIIEEQLSKSDEIRESEFKSSLSIPSHVASHYPSVPSGGDPYQLVEDLSSASLVTRELEQLVSKKHLASENLSLLTDFLVKHPSVRITDNSLSNRYKGHAYNCLAELLKFLHTHSVLDVLGSSHSEFVELLQYARSFAFGEDWLNGIERRALFPSLQFSQDASQKVLDSKQLATKEVEVLRLKIDNLTQHVEDPKHQLTSSEAVLESIIQQEAQVLEARAALSTPIGY